MKYQTSPVYRLRKVDPKRRMRNFTRDPAGWRVQVMHKNVYHVKVFSDSSYNNDFVQSLIAAKIYYLELVQKLGIAKEGARPTLELMKSISSYLDKMLKRLD